ISAWERRNSWNGLRSFPVPAKRLPPAPKGLPVVVGIDRPVVDEEREVVLRGGQHLLALSVVSDRHIEHDIAFDRHRDLIVRIGRSDLAVGIADVHELDGAIVGAANPEVDGVVAWLGSVELEDGALDLADPTASEVDHLALVVSKVLQDEWFGLRLHQATTA